MFHTHWLQWYGLGFGPMPVVFFMALIVLPFWQLFARAGYSPWWSLVMLVPGLNIAALYVLAFSDWPSQRSTTPPPVPRSAT